MLRVWEGVRQEIEKSILLYNAIQLTDPNLFLIPYLFFPLLWDLYSSITARYILKPPPLANHDLFSSILSLYTNVTSLPHPPVTLQYLWPPSLVTPLTVFASLWSNLSSSSLQSPSRGRSRSHTSPFTLATTVFSASPCEIPWAMLKGVVRHDCPSFTAPSGRVTCRTKRVMQVSF